MKKRRVKEFSLGFSLIEVVSGIAIILSIAGLLLSAITSAREKGLQAKCISNQKNLTAALIMYAVDHENFPTELAQLKLSPLQKERLSGAWVYADSSVPFYYDLQFGVTQCPKVQGKITDPTPTYSYGINEWVQGKSLSLITNPSETIVTSDSLNKAAISSVQDVDPRHMGGAFAGFADGHVELVKFSQLETFFTSSDTSSSLNTTDTFPSLPEGDTTGGILFYRGGVPTEEPVADENEDVEDNDDSAESEDSPPSDEDETEGKNSEDENEDENIEEPIEENDEEDLEDPTKDEEDLEDTENDDDSGEAHDNNGHGNNEDHDDEDNPGQGNGDHGHDHDEDTETSHDGIDDDEMGGSPSEDKNTSPSNEIEEDNDMLESEVNEDGEDEEVEYPAQEDTDEEDLEDTENDDDSGEAHDNNGHGNNEDHDDEDNPGQGNGDHGHDHDEDTETSHDGIDDDEMGGGNKSGDDEDTTSKGKKK